GHAAPRHLRPEYRGRGDPIQGWRVVVLGHRATRRQGGPEGPARPRTLQTACGRAVRGKEDRRPDCRGPVPGDARPLPGGERAKGGPGPPGEEQGPKAGGG